VKTFWCHFHYVNFGYVRELARDGRGYLYTLTMRSCACCLTSSGSMIASATFWCASGVPAAHRVTSSLRRSLGSQAESATLVKLATRMRCSQCGKKVAEVVAVARPRPRGGGRH